MTFSENILEFITAFEGGLSDDSFVKLSLDHYKGSEAGLKSIHVRRILIKREEKLSFTYRYKTRDIVKNFGMSDAVLNIRDALQAGFELGSLCTTAFDMILDKKSLKKKSPSQKDLPSLDHDRSKARLIAPEGKGYLRALNITDDKGQVFKNAQDKYRQINKYVEILSGLIKILPAEKVKKIVDMGAGKGYLTFALTDYLNASGFDAKITGVEYRADLVELCNKIAVETGFDNLDFVQGTVVNSDTTDANILIALHACDTATDDAIYKGITSGADLIVVAPCCHKQIRREIEKTKKSNDLDFLMKYGTFVERQSEMVTDGLRALILEYFGYSTKVFEFISDAHTPKNVMIVGIKGQDTAQRDAPRDPAILNKIKAAKEFFGIGEHHLEKLLGI